MTDEEALSALLFWRDVWVHGGIDSNRFALEVHDVLEHRYQGI